MKTFGDVASARDAIADFSVASLPPALAGKFREFRSDPRAPVQITQMGEWLYAHRDDDGMPVEARELLGGLISFATINAWYGLLEDNRGNRIVQAIRRDLGEEPPVGMEWPSRESDPAPKDEFREIATSTPMPS